MAERSGTETSLAKLACNRAGFQVANEAVQVLGGLTIEQMLNRVAAEVFEEHFSQRGHRRADA